MDGETGEVDATGADGVDADADAAGVEAYLADYAGFGDHAYQGLGGSLDVEVDEVLLLGFFPLGFWLLKGREGKGGREGSIKGGLTSQFWARRDTESVFHAKEVHPSASRPMDISCLRFMARTVKNGSPAPSPIPEFRN